MTSISTALFENIPKHCNDIWINKYHYTCTGLTNKRWSDNFSWTILKLRIMKEETTLKLPSGQQVGNVLFFLSILILLNILIVLVGPYFALFHQGCWRQTYGSNPVCPRLPFFGQNSACVGSSCHCCSNRFYSPNQIWWLSCQSCSTTFMKNRRVPLLRCQVGDEDAVWQKHLIENHKPNRLQFKARIQKQAWLDGESHSDMQINKQKESLSAFAQILLPERQRDI